MNYVDIKTNKKSKKIKWSFSKEIEIPKEWKKTIIGEHTSILVGNAFESVNYSNNTKDMKLLRGDNISEGIIRWKEKTRYWSKCLKLKKYQLCENDFVISMDGSKVGKNYAYVTKRDLPCLLVQRVACIRTHSTLSQKYLGYIFGSRNFINYVNSVKTNSGIPHISTKNIQNYHFLLPQFYDQQKIASILSRVDALIETTQKCIEKTQKLKKGLMHRLLIKGIGHRKFKKIKWLFGKNIEIPEEWKVNKLEELGSIITGNTPNTNNKDYFANDHLWASPTDLVGKKYVIQTNLMLSKKGFNISRKIPKNSILVVCIGSTIGKIGLSCQEMATNQQINSIICNQTNHHFIYYQLQRNKSLIKNMANQVAVPILNKTEFGKLKIIAPKKTIEQQKIASILSEVDAFGKCVNQIIDIFILKNLLLNYDIIHQTKLSIFINVYTKILILYKNNIG